MHTATIGDILITEPSAGALTQGTYVDVFVRRNVGFVPPSLSRPTLSVVSVDGGTTNLTVSGLTDFYTSDYIGWRFRINTPSSGTGPASIRVSGMTLDGSIIDSPAFNYEIRVGGTALDNASGAYPHTSWWRARGTYNVDAIQFDGADLGQPPVTPGHGEGGQEPEPTPPPVVTPTVRIRPGDLNSVGVPKLSPHNGGFLVNLRGLVEALPGGNVTSERVDGRTQATFTAPHAATGSITAITTLGDDVTVLIGGVPMSPAMFGIRRVGGQWFATVTAFPTLFGFQAEIG
jgi:hypothetical protein